MGQYYIVCNIDKEEILHPHKFGQGLKLKEFGDAGDSVGYALIALLADGNGRGGGDLFPLNGNEPHNLIGSWAGDRIVVAGDYADEETFIPEEILVTTPGINLYTYAMRDYRDISDEIMDVLINHDQWCELRTLDRSHEGWRKFNDK